MAERNLLSKNIYLIGMPGCGKSTLGKAVATALELEMVDLDKFIESQSGKRIGAIFSEDGESGFRQLEYQCLKSLSESPPAKVIAVGGGTPCFYGNMDFINEHGISIFLDVPIEILSERLLAQGTEERPLLKGKSPQQLLGQLQEHILQRKSYYLKALIHLEGAAISSDQILDELSALRT